MITILMMSAKMARPSTLDLIKIKAFWNKFYDVIFSTHDATNKSLLPDSNYIGDVGNSSISMRKVLITSIL